MARIVYGVQGDTNGHISRALAVAELFPEHEWLFVGGGAARKAQDAGYAYEPLPMLGVEVRSHSVQALSFVRSLCRFMVDKRGWTHRLQELVTAFDPCLLITDYEYFTPRAARALGRPCVSLDHSHVVSRAERPHIPGDEPSRFIFSTAMGLYVPPLAKHLMLSFQRQPLLYPEQDELFPPLPGEDVRAWRNAASGVDADAPALAYLPGCPLDDVLGMLGGRKREYRVYGYGRRPDRGNVRFREPGREVFIADLAAAAYVVSYAGHGLLTEALYLGKPCLCFPLSCQYEQLWNAFFVQHNGYGRYCRRLGLPPGELDAFEASLDACRRAIAAGDFDGRVRLRASLDAVIRSGV